MTEQSYGIIPFYRGEHGLEVFLIHQYGSSGDTLWTFPKGRGEEGETEIQTALREFKEETGMIPSFIAETQPLSTSYTFTRNGVGVGKTSTYFVGFVSGKDFIIQPEEVKEAGWFRPDEARAKITFPDYKILFDRALQNLDNS